MLSEITFTPSEELFIALVLADESLGMHQACEVIAEMHPIVEMLCLRTGRGRRWVYENLPPMVAKRIQRKLGEILTRWPSDLSRKEALVHVAREIRIARVEKRIGELRQEFAKLPGGLLGSPRKIQIAEECERLMQERAALTATQPEATA